MAPVPLLPIPRKELRYVRSKEWKKVNAYRRKLKAVDESEVTLFLKRDLALNDFSL